MSDYQKGVIASLLSLAIAGSWIVMEICKSFGMNVEIDTAFTSIAISDIVLILGITTPAGSALVSGVKKVAKSIGQKEDK